MRRVVLALLALLGLVPVVAATASVGASVRVENLTSGSASELTSLVSENEQLSNDGIRENIHLGYDLASDDAVAARTIPWSSKAVRDAAKALQNGATDVRIASRSQAEELFLGRYQGSGYRNTTGMSPREAKDFYGAKAGTYHWDTGAGAYPHGSSHLQIHTHEGQVVRIFFPD